MTKKKTLTIVIIIAAVLLVGYLAIGIFLPRILLAVTVNKMLPVGKSASPYTHYDVTSDNTMEISNGKISVSIPAGYIKKDMGDLGAQMYSADETQKCVIVLMEHQDMSYMDIMSDDNLDEYNIEVKIGKEQVKRGFEKLGNGFPDSAYATYKCVYLLEDDDYSFWDLEQGMAYAVVGIIKQILPQWGEVYMYENGEICGFVHINELSDPEEAKYRGTLELYSKADLNNETTVMVMANTPEEIYAIANSARPVA